MKVIVILYSFVILLYWPVDSRKCYDCSCDYNWQTATGSCSSTEFQSNCILKEFGDQYCRMVNSYNNNYEQRIFQSIPPDTYRDSHFFQAIEFISLSNTTWLPTAISYIAYGCDWDGCNHPSLAEYLPESFQMNVNETILNSALLNGQLPAQTCYSCRQCINELTAYLCSYPTCTNGICYINDIHNYVLSAENNCTFYFSSTCEPLTNPIQTPTLRIRATYYIDFPPEKQLEIDEIDITCTKDRCNSIETVENLKGQIETTINIHPGFQPYIPGDGTITTSKLSVVFLYFIILLL